MSFPTLSRRSLLVGAGASVLASCGGEPAPPTTDRVQQDVRLGPHPAQTAVLTVPSGRVRALVVLIHGGSWLAGPGPARFAGVAAGFEAEHVATWNIGYRGLEDGGGWPSTFEDVARAMDRVPELVAAHPRLRGVPVVLMGQSAGAHLAVWAASRTAHTPGGEPAFVPDSVLSVSGPLNLSRCATEGTAALANAVRALMAGTPATAPANYALGDPIRLRPAARVHVVQGLQDTLVPPWNATDYAATVRAVGADVDLTLIRGGHTAGLDPRGPDWPRVRAVIENALDR